MAQRQHLGAQNLPELVMPNVVRLSGMIGTAQGGLAHHYGRL